MSKEPIEVYHFLLDPRLGGPLVVVQNVAQRIQDVSTTVVTCGDGPGTDIKIAQIRRPFRAMYMLEFVVNIFVIFFKFFRIERRKNVVFHVHSATNNAPLIAASMLRVPVVWHFHSAIDANQLVHPMVAAIFGLFRRVSHQT
ncbi:MAG: hypothetical protein KDB07_11870, partial [Planctomycetes bacterium]|nr:hypothetical protein [Planctomycetota bacterium]